MATQQSRRATVKKRIAAFGGIRSVERIAESGASETENFRILPDGSLEKRCGWKTVIQQSGAIRGYWEGILSGTTYIFFVAGNKLCRLSQTDTAPVELAVLATSSDRVSFFLFRDRLYMMNGYTVMFFKPEMGVFSVAEGYAPLYGKNWHPTQMGEINEPRNLITQHLRVHYLNTSASKTFQLPYTAESVDAVRVNGTAVTNFSFTAPSSTVTLPDAYATGGEVLIAFTVDSLFSRRAEVLRSGHAVVYKDGYHETLLTYGGSTGYRVWRSAAVSDDAVTDARTIYSGSDGLYFRAGDEFSLGSQQHPVTAIVQYLDRALVFNDSNLWVLRHTAPDGDGMEISLFQSGIGCVATDGATLCRGVPVIVSGTGVGKIGFTNTEPALCTFTSLSGDIADRLSGSVLENAVIRWHDADSTLWVRDTTAADGTVWLCNPDRKQWTRYTGIAANGLISCHGSPGFTTADGKIAAFDEALDTDDGQGFDAVYLSQYLDFSQPEFCRRSGYAAICADSGGASIVLTLESERGSCTFPFTGDAVDVPEFFDGRFGIGRFRFLRYRITLSGTVRVRIYSLSVYATI